MNKRKSMITVTILLVIIALFVGGAMIYGKIEENESRQMGGIYDVLLHRTGTVTGKEENYLLVQSEESLLLEGVSEHSFESDQTIRLDCTELRYIEKEKKYVGYDISLEELQVGDSVTFYFFLYDVHSEEEVQIKAYAIEY